MRPKKRDRCVQRTVELSEADIAAIEAAEMTSHPEEPDLSAAKQAED
jgi:hypothetical protein